MGGREDAGFEFDQLSDSASDGDPADAPDRAAAPSDADGEAAAPAGPSVPDPAAPDPDAAVPGEQPPDGVRIGSGDDPPDPSDGPGGAPPKPGEEPTEPAGGPAEPSPDAEPLRAEGSDAGDDGAAEGADDTGDWQFDPVNESQRAFHFAEAQSRAAAESAYTHAVKSPLGWVIKRYTTPEVRQRLDEVFSRRMLGSVMVGGAFSKVIESVLGIAFGSASLLLPISWAIIFVVATVAFVWWEKLARQASEAATEAAEKATEAAERASETAEKATEAATEAAASESPGSTATGMAGAGVAPPAEDTRTDGATAATRAGGKRPSAVRSLSRGPDREPNKRFDHDGGAEGAEAPPAPFESGGFADAADGEELTGGIER